MRPLEGIRVLDLVRVLSGCTDASGRMLWRGNRTFAAPGVAPGVTLDK
jgi:hypothetical protein